MESIFSRNWKHLTVGNILSISCGWVFRGKRGRSLVWVSEGQETGSSPVFLFFFVCTKVLRSSRVRCLDTKSAPSKKKKREIKKRCIPWTLNSFQSHHCPLNFTPWTVFFFFHFYSALECEDKMKKWKRPHTVFFFILWIFLYILSFFKGVDEI